MPVDKRKTPGWDDAARKVLTAPYGERHGVATLVAREYGVSRTALYRWIAAYRKQIGPGAEPHGAHLDTPEDAGSRGDAVDCTSVLPDREDAKHAS